MPRIPGLPTLDPVSKPTMSPQEAGRPGEAISQMGDLGQETSSLEYKIRSAQEHVDVLAAQNQLAAVYADTQNKLSKTQNSRDVEGVIAESNKTLNEVSARWAKSPAVTKIQMNADALRPDLARIGTVKQVDLMGKEFQITIDKQAELLAGSYAEDRAAGGKGDQAEAAFNDAVDGGVKTNLIGDAQAEEIKRKFRQKGQELEIKNAITNANPAVNQKIYDEISQNRDKFPDVTQEQLDTMKGQALSAFEAHTKFQDWAEGEMARKTMLVPKINEFTNPATGLFDEAAALKDNADRFASGEITDTQSKVLAQGFSSHQAQLQVGMKQEANKKLDEIETDLSKHDFQTAKAKLQANQPWFENNGFADDYRAALHYVDTQEREVRAEASARRSEARYEYMFQRQLAQENSDDTFVQVQHGIAQGMMITYPELQKLAGNGKGQMLTKDIDKAWGIMQKAQTQPDFAAAIKQLSDSFPEKGPKGQPLTDAQKNANNRKYAQTLDLFEQQVNANPNESKQKIMNDLLKTKEEGDVKAAADAMFGIRPPTASHVMESLRNFFSAPFTAGLKPADVPGANKTSAPAVSSPARPATVPGNYVWNPSGNGGKGSWKAPSQ